MKASDTVINNVDILDLNIPCEDCAFNVFMPTKRCLECVALKHREKQAEISFKASMEAVGEWLEGQRVASEDFVPKGQNKYIITAKELADLKAGKIPELLATSTEGER